MPARSGPHKAWTNLAVGVFIVATALSGCSSGASRPATVAPLNTTSSTGGGAVAETTTSPTPTTVDPGTLPQTVALPSQSDPVFLSRVQSLWTAIVDGNPSEGSIAFFPLSAYIQVKAISDPVHDYQTRLISNFDSDIEAAHSIVAAYGEPESFVAVSVPPAAEWIRPGVEYNKGSYWRVYGTTVTYAAGGRRHTLEIHSLISWRGEWYVVHLGAIR